jgi:ABC-2 type transport system permease protein
MAGVVGALPESSAGGWLSPLARAQYAALGRMRWSVFRNTIRSTRGALELGATTVTMVVFSLLGLGLAFGLGAGAYGIASHGSWKFLPLLFWGVFVMWQVVPITLASFQQQFDMGGLLRFPVSFGAFFLLHLLFGLFDISTIVGALCCTGIWCGLSIARPDLIAWSAIALLVFAAFNILLVRTIFSWIDRWLAQRRTREIVIAIFFVLMLGLQLLNPGLRKHGDTPQISAKTRTEAVHWMHSADSIQRWLPPGAAAHTVQQSDAHQPVEALAALCVLGLFTFATGATLGVRLRAEYRGENLGEAPSRAKAERPRRELVLGGSGPIAAVLEKELHTLFRSIPMLYQMAAPILVAFVLASINRNAHMGSMRVPLGLLFGLAYAFVGFTQFVYNNLGGEGAGIQLLFLSPTPIRTVMMAKNLFHAALFAVDATIVAIVVCWRLGTPPPDALAASVAWVLFALPLHLGAGNLFSLTMPYKINLGRIGRQKGSQGNALLSMLVQAGALGLGAGVMALCAFFGRLWLAIPIFVLLAVVAVLGWMRILSNVDRMANARRDDLISALVKAE